MDDSSKSQHTDPTASSLPPGFGIGSTISSSLSVGNNPLPPPSPQGGTTTSSTKRKNIINDHGQKEELEDDADSQFIPIKRHQTESSTADEESDAAMNAASPRRKEEFNLLYDILRFYKRTGRYPYDHFKDLNEFNKDNWIGKQSRVYENEDELSGKMRELHERFLKNLEKTRNGEILENLMDEIEVEIYLLSYKVWVFEDDDGDNNGGNDSTKDEKISKDSFDQQETGDEVGDDDHAKDSSDEKSKHDSKESSDQQQETDGDDESKGLSSKDSKDSLSKDSTKWNSEDLASKDSKDSSSKDSLKDNSKDSSSKDSKDSSSKDSKDSNE